MASTSFRPLNEAQEPKPPGRARRDVARTLRKNATETERRLWRHLKGRQRLGYRFRRQHPIGRYVVDFCCLEAKLVVELDGGHHAVQTTRDRVRTDWLEAAGFHVVRFWNNDVFNNLEGVVIEIENALRKTRG